MSRQALMRKLRGFPFLLADDRLRFAQFVSVALLPHEEIDLLGG